MHLIKVIAEYDGGVSPPLLSKEYVYSGSTLVATIEGGTTTYHHQDYLSVRVTTDASGVKVGEQGHYPFGESWYTQSTTTKWQFTSYDRDGESGLDYAMFRYDSSRLGRFLTPDPIAGSPLDPQSLNRYAYVANNPVNLVDPLGLRMTMAEWLQAGGGGRFDRSPWRGLLYGSGSGCTIDGAPASCGLVSNLVGNRTAFDAPGIAVPCPNNICSGTGTDPSGNTVFLEFRCTAGRCGYHTLSSSAPKERPLSPLAIMLMFGYDLARFFDGSLGVSKNGGGYTFAITDLKDLLAILNAYVAADVFDTGFGYLLHTGDVGGCPCHDYRSVTSRDYPFSLQVVIGEAGGYFDVDRFNPYQDAWSFLAHLFGEVIF